MKRLTRLIVVTGVLSVTIVTRAQLPAGATVESRGVRVEMAAPQGYDELVGVGWEIGTTVSILVTLPNGGIISFDERASQVTSFKDDRGKDLLAGAEKDSFRGAGIGNFPKVSKDGKRLVFNAYSKGVPTKGAKAITVAGEALLQAATQKQDFTAPNVLLKENTEFKAGNIPFTIAKVGKPESSFGGFGGEEKKEFAVTLRAKQDLADVVEIKFLKAAGQNLGASSGGGMTARFGTVVTVDKEYHFKAKAEAATIVVTRWTDLKQLKIPFSFTVGVGL